MVKSIQTPEDIMQAYNDLGAMLDIVSDTAGSENFVYEALYDEYSAMSEYIKSYETRVNDLNDNLAQQYTLSALIGREIPKTKEEFEKYRQEVIRSAISSGEFAGTNENIADAIDSVLSKQSSFVDFYNATETEVKGVTVASKSAFDILEEVQGGYDGLVSALADVTSEGYLTAEALSTLFKLEKENALAGLQLSQILTRDANGYKLAGDALQQYIQALITAYTIEGTFATQEDKDNAIANLETLRAVLATLAATSDESTDVNKAYRDELEKEQDIYQDQLDKLDELIEIRKGLLQTYKEELDYQKELEKRQRNVASLQTKLSVARLDQSAAGQARVRELETELEKAQDELDDFTLEHAIDVLIDQLDSEKAIIQDKLDEITKLLNGLDTTPEVNVTTDTSWVAGALSQIEGLIRNANQGGIKDEAEKIAAKKAAQDYIDSHGMLEGDKARWGQDANFLQLLNAYILLGGSIDDLVGKVGTYHSGGFVGDIAPISSNEEFAKLLKGEFVVTPAQMQSFMNHTLPNIVNHGQGGHEFNAPLISIQCESVTTETMPKLEQVVDKAVKQIQDCLDKGMNRMGHRTSKQKLLF